MHTDNGLSHAERSKLFIQLVTMKELLADLNGIKLLRPATQASEKKNVSRSDNGFKNCTGW